ncbi:conserved hypothetical protein [Gammaproteobacteria bacterium]
MAVRVSPTEAFPTHHVALKDRDGKQVGLILCDSSGKIATNYGINPVERTALKTSSGNSTYSDFEYPYSPITQDDWSGGRGGIDFERDSTKYLDSFRVRTGRANKVFLGPQEQWTSGYQSMENKTPGNVSFYSLALGRSIAKRFPASASYTAALAWLIMRRKGSPANLRISIYSDNAGSINAELSFILVASTRLTDVLSEWLNETMSQALTSGTYYWIVAKANSSDEINNHWEVAVSDATGTTYTSSGGSDWTLMQQLDTETETRCMVSLGGGVVLAGTVGSGKIYKSADSGASWTVVQQLGTETTIRSMVSLGGGVVLAGTGPTGQVYKSIDSGATWSLIQRLGAEQYVFSLVSLGGGVVLAGTQSTGLVYKSTDSGATWNLIQRLGTETIVFNLVSLGGGVVLAGTGPTGQVYKSTDSGATWSLIQQLGTEQYVFSMVSLGSGVVLAGTHPTGKVYKSTDSGATWSLIQQLGTETIVRSLVSLGSGVVLAGTGPSGQVYKSTDSGATWSLIQRLGTETDVRCLIGLGSGVVLAGTGNSGQVWKYIDSTTAWTLAGFDLYYRLTVAQASKSAIFYEYKEQQYVVLSDPSGAPKLYMNGDRGAADANTGQLTKLIDATKSWTVNAWAGCVVQITDGFGKTEPQTWRKVVSNTATELVVDAAWTITHDTTTEYVITGAATWREITGHGLTGPVKGVLVSTFGVVYFAMGPSVLIRRHREYNNAGTWMESSGAEWADESAASYADFLTYKPQAKLIFRGQNSDASGDVSVSSASAAAWGTALTFSAVNVVGSKYRKMTQMECYPDSSGNEAIYVFKTDRPWVVPSSGNPYPLSLREMETVRSEKNGAAALVHNVYLYFSLQNGLERYYGGNLDEVGPNVGEGLPSERQGPLVALLGYPGKFFAAINASAGYSSLGERDGNGWHERYRAPKGQPIKALGFQVIPGTAPDRMWIYQGNDLIWIPFPSETTNELDDSQYKYTHEGSLTLARMHAGMMDVQKLAKLIKLWTNKLSAGACWLELDYKLNEDEGWTTYETPLVDSPQTRIDLTSIYGLGFKRLQLRVRFYTSDASKTPLLLAVIVEAVTRVDVKYMYPLTFRLMDLEETLAGRDPDDIQDGLEKLEIIKDWADAATNSMLLLESQSRLWHGKMVFLNPPDVRQVKVNTNPENENTRDVYVCSTTVQEA